MRGVQFASKIPPKHRRRLATVYASRTELWLDGLATRDFEGTLRTLLGTEAPLSAATTSRVNKQLLADLATWNSRRLDELNVIFAWADGVYLSDGRDDERRVFLIVVGTDRTGHKHWVALQEAMSAVADQGWPTAAQQRCWLFKMRNVEEKLPKNRREALHEPLGMASESQV